MLLIDAHNVLHLPEALEADLDIPGLCGLLGLSRYAGRRAVMICDGAATPGSGASRRGSGAGKTRISGVEVVFTGAHASADDEIEARLRAAGGAGIVVVSDDRRLKRAASRARASGLPSRTFLAHLLQDRSTGRRKAMPSFARDIPLDRYSVAHWASEMGLAIPEPPGLGSGPARTAGRAEPAPPPAGAPEKHRKPEPAATAPPELPDERALRLDALARDPVIREALEAWDGRLSIEELDMERWLRERPRAPRGEPSDRR